MPGLVIAGLVLLVIGLFCVAFMPDDIHIGFLVIVLAVCLFALAWIESGSNKEAESCVQRGGEVVRSGQYGNIVNCINIPNS